MRRIFGCNWKRTATRLAAITVLAVPGTWISAQGAGAASTTTTTVIAVPASIDATGKTEVSGALMAYFATLPKATTENPVTLTFAKDGTYWVDYTLMLATTGSGGIRGVMWKGVPVFALNNYRFDLNGATLVQRTTVPYAKVAGTVLDPRKRWGNPILFTAGVTNFEIFNGTLTGSAPAPAYRPAYEDWMGIHISAKEGVRVDHVVVRDLKIQNTWGDFIYLSAHTAADRNALTDVRITNNVMRNAGRQGIVLNGGNGVLIEGNDMRNVARLLFDSEPVNRQGFSNVVINRNTGTSGNLGYFQYMGTGDKTVADHLTITNNTLNAGHFSTRLVGGPGRVGFTFANNVSNATKGFNDGGIYNYLIAAPKWDQVEIRNNREVFDPKAKVTAVNVASSPSVIVEGNTWDGAFAARVGA